MIGRNPIYVSAAVASSLMHSSVSLRFRCVGRVSVRGRAQRRSQFSRTSVASYGCPRETVATRLFGSAPRSDGNDIPGKIFLSDEQDSLKNIDLKRIEKTVYDIRTLIGYKTYDVNVFLIDDNEMREVNKESRNIDGPTDILSFPFHEAIKPGEIELPRFDIPDYYALGDMLIDVPYVLRICKEDKEENTGLTDVRDETCERGVSGAMSKVYDPQVRMEMLLVHGMLHLVGYDHENDDEHIEMASREEEILAALRLGA